MNDFEITIRKPKSKTNYNYVELNILRLIVNIDDCFDLNHGFDEHSNLRKALKSAEKISKP
jgi:hypothetical protein